MPGNKRHIAELSVPQARRMIDATRWYEAHGRNRGTDRVAGGNGLEDLWIEITGATLSSGVYYHAWKKKERVANGTGTGGGWRDDPRGLVSSASGPDTRAIMPDGSLVATGSIVGATVDIGLDGIITYTIDQGGDGGGSVPAGTHFEVKLSSPSGSAGDATTQCAFNYTVKDLNNVTLGTGMSPEWAARPLVGVMTAATRGAGYYDTANTFTLAIAYETPGAVERDCEPA